MTRSPLWLTGTGFRPGVGFSEITHVNAAPDLPDNPDLTIAAGRELCEVVVAPLGYIPMQVVEGVEREEACTLISYVFPSYELARKPSFSLSGVRQEIPLQVGF